MVLCLPSWRVLVWLRSGGTMLTMLSQCKATIFAFYGHTSFFCAWCSFVLEMIFSKPLHASDREMCVKHAASLMQVDRLWGSDKPRANTVNWVFARYTNNIDWNEGGSAAPGVPSTGPDNCCRCFRCAICVVASQAGCRTFLRFHLNFIFCTTKKLKYE